MTPPEYRAVCHPIADHHQDDADHQGNRNRPAAFRAHLCARIRGDAFEKMPTAPQREAQYQNCKAHHAFSISAKTCALDNIRRAATTCRFSTMAPSTTATPSPDA